MKIYKVWYDEYNEDCTCVVYTVEKYYSTWEKAIIAASKHTPDGWTGRAHVQEIEVE